VKRALVIILDGVGIGELPDAARYGDEGSDTLGNLSRAVDGLHLPTLENMGLGCIHTIQGVECIEHTQASYGKMAECSPGKDSTTGHWELAGLILDRPFPTYPNGFPQDIIDQFCSKSGYDIIGNYPASGTEIIKELGETHLQSGKLIVYTSADSVFQIAAHEKLISLEELYRVCEIARDILTDQHAIARVIARPFTGKERAEFKRTKYRRDFSLKPIGDTILKRCQKNGIQTVGIGKINDLYADDGIDLNIPTKTNNDGMAAMDKAVEEIKSGLIMTNLVDFDMLWGHRNDQHGFQRDLEDFDIWLSNFTVKLIPEDVLIITADHGNDPTTPSTDHSREYVPLLFFGPRVSGGINLGARETFADVAATLSEFFEIQPAENGKSFLQLAWN
jgi:phosphopentomutase